MHIRPRTALNGPAIRHAFGQRQFLRGAVVFGLVLLAAGLSASCRGDASGTLQNLNNIGDLRARFNRDAGKPRIVLLLSPT